MAWWSVLHTWQFNPRCTKNRGVHDWMSQRRQLTPCSTLVHVVQEMRFFPLLPKGRRPIDLTEQGLRTGLALGWTGFSLFSQLPSGQATPLQPVWAPALKILWMVNFWQPDVATVQWAIALYGSWGWGKLLQSAKAFYIAQGLSLQFYILPFTAALHPFTHAALVTFSRAPLGVFIPGWPHAAVLALFFSQSWTCKHQYCCHGGFSWEMTDLSVRITPTSSLFCTPWL